VLLATSASAATADLYLYLDQGVYNPIDPGGPVTYRYYAANTGPETVEARLIQPLPPGAHFVAVSHPDWTCSEGAGEVVCRRTLKPPTDYYDAFVSITISAPEDPAGGRFSWTTRLESDADDPTPLTNRVEPVTLVVYHALMVTTPDDFGDGSLRAIIERANVECDATLPCKVRFAGPMRIAPRAPLPAITACDLLIDGGARGSFDVARTVEISGAEAGSGSGFRIESQCRANGRGGAVELRALAINSFRDNGVDVGEPMDTAITVSGCFIGTDPAGTIALPNGLRGISADARKAEVHVYGSLIAGNARSGVALWNVEFGDLAANLIGIRYGGAPLPNGASGVYINGGFLRLSSNTIEYNRDFGVAVGPGAGRVVSEHDYIHENGGLAIDWGLDGPTSIEASGRMPPVPRLIDAFYDPATRRTTVRGVIPAGAFPAGFHSVRAYIGGADAPDFGGGLEARSQAAFVPASGKETAFEIVIAGDFRGARMTALTLLYSFLDGPPVAASEYSAGILVR